MLELMGVNLNLIIKGEERVFLCFDWCQDRENGYRIKARCGSSNQKKLSASINHLGEPPKWYSVSSMQAGKITDDTGKIKAEDPLGEVIRELKKS